MVISTVCDQPRGKPATPHMPLADSQGERRRKHIRPAPRMTMDAAHVQQHHKRHQNISCRLLVMLFVVSCNQYLPVILHLRFQHVSKLTADGSRDRNSNDDEVKVYFRTLYAILARIDCRPWANDACGVWGACWLVNYFTATGLLKITVSPSLHLPLPLLLVCKSRDQQAAASNVCTALPSR